MVIFTIHDSSFMKIVPNPASLRSGTGQQAMTKVQMPVNKK